MNRSHLKKTAFLFSPILFGVILFFGGIVLRFVLIFIKFKLWMYGSIGFQILDLLLHPLFLQFSIVLFLVSLLKGKTFIGKLVVVIALSLLLAIGTFIGRELVLTRSLRDLSVDPKIDSVTRQMMIEIYEKQKMANERTAVPYFLMLSASGALSLGLSEAFNRAKSVKLKS